MAIYYQTVAIRVANKEISVRKEFSEDVLWRIPWLMVEALCSTRAGFELRRLLEPKMRIELTTYALRVKHPRGVDVYLSLADDFQKPEC